MKTEKLYDLFLECEQNITTDTRKDLQNSMFFCLKGDNFDANTMAESAKEKGAKIVVTERKDLQGISGYWVIEDALKTMQRLATIHRETFAIPIVAIGGSNGKTTTKELLFSILKQQFEVFATPGNFNNHIGVPLTLLQLRKHHQIGIVELGINHPDEMTELCHIAKPHLGLLTNIGKEHLEGLGSLEGVAKAESELFDYLLKNEGTAFVNLDDVWLKNMAKRLPKQWTYSMLEKDAKTFVRAIVINPEIKFSHMDLEINSALSGDYNFSNIVASIAVAEYFKVTPQNIKQGIESYVPSNNRSQWLKTETNNLLMDCYNANPSSMELAIKNFAAMPREHKFFIVGDMLEMGSYADEEHLSMLKLLKNLASNKNVFCVGESFDKHKNSFGFQFFIDSEKLTSHFQENPIKNAFVLLKASRGVKLEKIVAAL